MRIFTSALFLLILSVGNFSLFGQKNVGIGTLNPDSSALLDLSSTNKGLLVPRLTTSQMDSIPIPSLGLLIYNTDSNCFAYYKNVQVEWVYICDISDSLRSSMIISDTARIHLAYIDSLIATYAQFDSTRTHLAYIDSLFAKNIWSDSIFAHYGSFDTLYVNGTPINTIISDSINSKAWLLNGNNSIKASNFIGSINNADVIFKRNNIERLHLYKDSVIIGNPLSTTSSLFRTNRASFISGLTNTIDPLSYYSFVSGQNNSSKGNYSFLFGHDNSIAQTNNYETVVMGSDNSITSSGRAFIFSAGSKITNSAENASIVGGVDNWIDARQVMGIFNGILDTIQNSGAASIYGSVISKIKNSEGSTIFGGSENTIEQSLPSTPNWASSSIVGGLQNKILNQANSSIILGGRENTVVDGGINFVMGRGNEAYGEEIVVGWHAKISPHLPYSAPLPSNDYWYNGYGQHRRLFTIGAGFDTDPKNAFMVLHGGNVAVGNFEPLPLPRTLNTISSTFNVKGSEKHSVRWVSGTDVPWDKEQDYILIFANAGSDGTCQLPTAAACPGRVYHIVNYSGDDMLFNQNIYVGSGNASNVLPQNSRMSLVSVPVGLGLPGGYGFVRFQ